MALVLRTQFSKFCFMRTFSPRIRLPRVNSLSGTVAVKHYLGDTRNWQGGESVNLIKSFKITFIGCLLRPSVSFECQRLAVIRSNTPTSVYLARLGIDAVVTMDPSIDVCVTCFRSLSRSVRSCKNAGGAHFRGQVNEGKVWEEDTWEFVREQMKDRMKRTQSNTYAWKHKK